MWAALPLLAWLLAGVLLLVFQRPLFDPLVLILAPPLALLAALGSVAAIGWARSNWNVRAKESLLMAGTLVALGVTLLAGLWLDARQIHADSAYDGGRRAQMVQALQDHTIPSGSVATDDQYVAALEGRDTPPELGDNSLVRARDRLAHDCKRSSASSGATMCNIVFFVTDRLDRLPGLRAWVEANSSRKSFGAGDAKSVARLIPQGGAGSYYR
jgi:hypothetical protein